MTIVRQLYAQYNFENWQTLAEREVAIIIIIIIYKHIHTQIGELNCAYCIVKLEINNSINFYVNNFECVEHNIEIVYKYMLLEVFIERFVIKNTLNCCDLSSH